MQHKIKSLILCAASFLAGIFNALIGAGGGILLTLALSHVCRDTITDRRDVLVNSQAAMIPGCALSCIIYAVGGSFRPEGFAIYAIPAVVGGAIGALLLPRIKSSGIKKLFSAIVIWSGIRMIMR